MRPVLVIQHEEETPPGRLTAAFGRAGVEPLTVRVDLGEPLPDLTEVCGVIVLGGEAGSYQEDRYPFLIDEKKLLREAVDRSVPVLGICLGAQLLADALGGKAFKADRPEVGVVQVTLTAEGAAHPVVSRLGRRVFSVHQDSFALPPGAVLLAESDRFPQAFECGSALALQFHPEAEKSIGMGWARSEGGILGRVGITRDELGGQLDEWDDQLDSDAAALFDVWLDRCRRASDPPEEES
jgi:GMP synthase (glutamine-hydrolysing)